MIKVGNVLKNKVTGNHCVVTSADIPLTVVGYDGIVFRIPELSFDSFAIYDSILDVLPVTLATPSALDTQHGGDHYKQLGDYQPWQVLKAWLTEEEFRGYMKGTAIERLARERNKGGDLDIKKAAHTLQGFIEIERL
jgi:hypothetical protein